MLRHACHKQRGFECINQFESTAKQRWMKGEMNHDKNDFDSRAKDWDLDPEKKKRAEIAAGAIMNKVQPSKECTAFEYGCGTGLVSFFLQPFLKRIVMADSSRGMLEVVRSKIEKTSVMNMTAIEIDLTKSDPPEEQFDIIYTLLAMHHVSDVPEVLRKFHSMLRTGGHLCIADLDKEDGSFHGEGFSGHHGFDREELESKAERAGFINVEFQTIDRVVREHGGKGKREYPLFLMTCSSE